MILSLLRTRRWIGFTALVVGAIVGFGLLSQWQWNRADERRAERVELQAAVDAPPAPLAGLAVSAEGGVATADQWRSVTVTGEYLPETQVLVRKRPLDAKNGFWTMTALRADEGTVVWVNRGWLSTSGDALSTPDAPAPPPAPVTVTGYLRPFEASDPDANDGLPAGQVAAVSPAVLPTVAEPFGGYLQLSDSDPEQTGLIAIPLPTVDEGRNVSYAVQWLLFAFVAMGGWYFFLRREALEDAQRQAATAAPDDAVDTTSAGRG